MLFITGFIIVIGGLRGIVISGDSVLHSAEIIDSSLSFVSRAATTWSLKQRASYIFLQKYMPQHCPLLSFDQDEFELIPEIGRAHV